MIKIIINIKNPNKIFEYCLKYNVYIDLLKDVNSHFWMKLLENYYKDYIELKNVQLSLKDFYVLLYYTEIFTLLNDLKLIDRAQKLLLKLPQIYQGDHIAIIHASNNIALRMNKANAIMTRNTNENKCNLYGLGYLVIRYLDNNGNDEFVEKFTEKYKYVSGVDPLKGDYILI